MNIGGFQYKIFGKYLLLLLLTVVYSVSASFAETSDTHSDGKAAEKFNPEEVIMHHIGDAHEWHYATIGHTHYTFPLPVILYSSDRGIEIFSSSRFHHAEGMQMVEANETAENAAQQGETDSANIKT